MIATAWLLDRRLPDLDAGEVAGFIRQRYPRTTIEVVASRKIPGRSDEAEKSANAETMAQAIFDSLP